MAPTPCGVLPAYRGDPVNLLLIACRVAAVTVDAGAPTLLIEDLGLDEGGMKKMVEQISWEALARAAENALPGALERIPDWAKPGGLADPESLLHEMEHLVFDPNFDLIGGKSGHHPVEGAMDEAFSAGIRNLDKLVGGAYDASESNLIGDSKTVKEALDRISTAPISTEEKKRIRDAAVSETRRLFADYLDKSVDEQAELDKPLVSGCRKGAPWGIQITVFFLNSVLKRYDSWKDLMAKGQEDVWRRFVLNVRNEFRKAAKPA